MEKEKIRMYFVVLDRTECIGINQWFSIGIDIYINNKYSNGFWTLFWNKKIKGFLDKWLIPDLMKEK